MTSEQLEKMRSLTDPTADKVIEQIMASGEVIEVNAFFRKLVENSDLPTDEMPETIRTYFKQTAVLPDYTDYDLIRKGEAFFEAYGSEIAMMLLAKSLPASYACKKGAEVLHRTGRLDASRSGGLKRFTRRLMETSQFVINVLDSGGLSPQGKGIRSAQKVRLMHASIRFFLKKSGWDTALYDEPINQEDMAGTLMDFAVYPIEGLEQIGIDVSKEEKEAYFHVWRVIGHVMGVLPELIPDNFDSGSKLGHTILNRQKAPSEAGTELTEACIMFMEHITPGTLFDFYPSVLVRYLIGDELADMLQIKEYEVSGRLQKTVFSVFDAFDDLKDDSELIRKLARRFNSYLLQGMVNYFNEDKQVQFYIPPSLRKNWT